MINSMNCMGDTYTLIKGLSYSVTMDENIEVNIDNSNLQIYLRTLDINGYSRNKNTDITEIY